MNTLVPHTEKVICRILGESAYLFVDKIEHGGIPDPAVWPCEGVILSFRGPACGSVSLWAQRPLFQYAAANMLGIDPNHPDAIRKGIDAMKELLNIIVGNLLTDVYGNERCFELGLPQVAADPSFLQRAAEGNDVLLWFAVEGNVLAAVIHLDPEIL